MSQEVRDEWLGQSTTQAFLEGIRVLREQVAAGVIESIKAGTLNEQTMCMAGGELRALDQIHEIALRKGRTRGQPAS